MNRRTKVFILTILIGLILVYFTYSKFDFQDVINSFKNFDARVFVIYLIAVILIEIFLVIRWTVILRAFKMNIPFMNLFLYRMSGYAIGYLSPQAHIGGEPVRALLLKRHKIEFKKGISTVLIDKSMQITTDLLYAFIGFSLLVLHFSISRKLELIIYSFIVFASLLLGLYFYCMIKKKPFFSAILNFRLFKKFKKLRKDTLEVENTIHTFYVKHFKHFIGVILVNFILYSLMVLEYSSAIALFGFTPNLYTIFIIMGAVALSYSFPIPMALGVLEASQVGMLGIVNINAAIGLSISILVRIKDMIRTLIGSLALFYYGMSWHFLFRQLKSK